MADVLDRFYRAVVAVVDQRRGFINKFQGDAALVVFGAPAPAEDPATDAAATARDLATRLHALPDLDFGIGVSAAGSSPASSAPSSGSSTPSSATR